MTNSSSLPSFADCTGCLACLSVCNHNAIHLVRKELHYHVAKNDKCIDCGLCSNVCPSLHNPHLESYDQRYYSSWNKDNKERRLSTSGGIGGAIAKYSVENGYYVVGAMFDENYNLIHKISNDLSILDKIRGSKYLQSDTNEIYRKVKELLKSGEKVLFTGTPCQIEAVKSVVGANLLDRLITCGIICHGVNSPYVWKDYVAYLQKDGDELVSYNFRSKAKGWGKLFVEYSFKSKTSKIVPAWKNLFHDWFGKHYILRESCMNCTYRTKQRYSDISIGDFWGIEKVEPSLSVREGVSVLIISTKNGEKFIEGCPYLLKQETDSEKTQRVLKGFINRKSARVINQETLKIRQFSAEYDILGFENMKKKYPCPTYMDRVKDYVKSHIMRQFK